MTVPRGPLRSPLRSPLYSPTVGKFGYEGEAIALFARFTTQPPEWLKDAINNLIKAFKNVGAWALLDVYGRADVHDEQAAQRNWIADAYNATAVASPTFTAYQGYTTDGAASYLNLNFNPATAVSPKFVQNSASFGFTSRTAGQANAFDMGQNGTSRVLANIRTTSNFARCRVNDGTSSTAANSTGTGRLVLTRPDANTKRIFHNGAQLGTDIAMASLSPTSGDILVGAGGGTFAARQYSQWLIGANLSASVVAAISSAEAIFEARIAAQA